jgi:hypothetical protein
MAITPPEPSAFEDRLVELLPDPDGVGSSEYRMLHEHVLDTIQDANIGGDDVASLLRSSLDELEDEVARVRSLIREASRPASASSPSF